MRVWNRLSRRNPRCTRGYLRYLWFHTAHFGAGSVVFVFGGRSGAEGVGCFFPLGSVLWTGNYRGSFSCGL